VNGYANLNYTVGVGAVDGSGVLADYSNRGKGMSIVAYGGPPFTIREPDNTGALTQISTQNRGTSLATPMVAGALALAMQRWPQASGNQLIRVMADTSDGLADHMRSLHEDTGEGMLLNAPLLVKTDPSGYDDTNPFVDKEISGGSGPDDQDVQDYYNGAMDPDLTVGDETYVYRGCEDYVLEEINSGRYSWVKTDLYTAPGCEALKPTEEPPDSATPQTSEEVSESVSIAPWWFGGGAGGLLVVGLAIVLVVRARRRSTPTQQVAAAYASNQYFQGEFPPYPSRHPYPSEQE
jgi:hypothetical protein